MKGYDTCYGHRPDLADARRRNARKGGRAGGRGRGPGEIRNLKALLEDLTSKVIRREIPGGTATVANQLINTRLRAIEQERKLKETEDLEARVEALERGGRGTDGRSRATS